MPILPLQSTLHHTRTGIDARLADAHLTSLDTWASNWFYPSLRDRLDIQFSGRLTTSLGLCKPARAQIRLNTALLEPGRDLLLRETLAHEAAHFVVYEHFGRNVKPHGLEWQTMMRAAGFKPRARIPSDAIDWQPKRRQRYLYEHACTSCGQLIVARRTNRNWRCRTCLDEGLSGRLHLLARHVE